MEFIRGIANIRARHAGCVLTIGNFDGVHLGHQYLLQQLRRQASALNVPMMVMIFEPQPREFFSPELAPVRLTALRDKVRLLAEQGVDYLLCLPFNRKLSLLTAEQFVDDILVKKLMIKQLHVGEDFCFGAKKQGNLTTLAQAAVRQNFTLHCAKDFCLNGKRISSTEIRAALQRGDLEAVQQGLGRQYSISGRVLHGQALGRTLGFPTANIRFKGISGVYAVEVCRLDSSPIAAVANLGKRPTVDGIAPLLEVHLLDQQRQLYGLHIEVVLRKKIRDEMRFSSLNQLKQQISNDVMAAKHYFLANPLS